MVNGVGREIPEKIGDYVVRPYRGPYEPLAHREIITRRLMGEGGRRETKRLSSIREAIEKSGLRSGMTISFHHCFREGDRVIGQLGIKRNPEYGDSKFKVCPQCSCEFKKSVY